MQDNFGKPEEVAEGPPDLIVIQIAVKNVVRPPCGELPDGEGGTDLFIIQEADMQRAMEEIVGDVVVLLDGLLCLVPCLKVLLICEKDGIFDPMFERFLQFFHFSDHCLKIIPRHFIPADDHIRHAILAIAFIDFGVLLHLLFDHLLRGFA